MARRTIDPAVIEAVVNELKTNPEVNVVELAKRNGLSAPTVYKYRKNLTVTPVGIPVEA